MEIGTRGIITFGDEKTSKVEIVKIQEYPASGMGSDYFLKYDETETYKPIFHPEQEDGFLLPEELFNQVFTQQ